MERVSAVFQSIKWINELFEKGETPKFLLDPLTTIVKLSMLTHKDPLTKIRVANNKISFSDPSPFQGLDRWLRGDSRTNIHYLYLPLLYFCHLKYLSHSAAKDSRSDSQNVNSLGSGLGLSEVMDFYNDLAVAGIHALKQTYLTNKNDLVINCLDLYLLMLTSEDESSIRQRYDKINTTTKNIYEEFLKCWNRTNIEVITNLFRELDQKRGDSSFVNKTLEVVDNYLEAINYKINGLRDP